MKHFDDDPNKAEIERNIRITENTNELLKDNLSRIIEHEEAMDKKMKQLSRENTNNTILLITIVACTVGVLLLQLFGNLMR